MESPHKSGTAVQVCIFLFFAVVAAAMGLTAFHAGASLIFTVVWFGMAGLVIVLMIAVLHGGSRGYDMHDSPDFVPLKTRPSVTYRAPAERERIIYQAPTQCPRCGASISSERVDWVGPLQVVCPYCNATIDAVGRDI